MYIIVFYNYVLQSMKEEYRQMMTQRHMLYILIFCFNIHLYCMTQNDNVTTLYYITLKYDDSISIFHVI